MADPAAPSGNPIEEAIRQAILQQAELNRRAIADLDQRNLDIYTQLKNMTAALRPPQPAYTREQQVIWAMNIDSAFRDRTFADAQKILRDKGFLPKEEDQQPAPAPSATN